MFKRIFDIDEWKVIERRLHKDDMRLSESIMSAGNGYMGLRGNFEEKYSGDTHRGTYIAGVWFPDKTRVGWWKIGYPEYFGKVINSTNFIGIGLKVNNHEVDLAVDEVLDFYRELDMKTGVLSRRAVVNTPVGIVEIDTERFLSLKQQEAAAIKYMVRCPDNDAIIELAPYLDGAVYNEDSNYKESFWQEAYRRSDDCKGTVIMKTKDNPFGAPTFSACTSMKITHYGKVQDISSVDRESFVETKITFNANAGEWVGIDKIVALTSTRQISADALAEKAEEIAENMARLGYVEAKYQNALCWRDRWNKADVVIEGDVEAQQGIRYNIFQLFSTYYGEDATLNIGPKGFTGEKYGGATYWDTEAFLLPFYLALASEEVSRNLLIYRHNQLEGAYTNARKQGLEGALYPMVTFTGVECHNEWEITFEEIHRNGAIAHAIFEYINYTGDKSYLHNYGIDVLVGISRFWASRVHYSSSKKMYMIHGVTGPNEYENNVNNNWYTNRIAAWCLEYTLEAIDNLRVNGYSSKLDELGIKVLELDRWKDIAENMYLPYDATSGVFVQHDTFLDKDLIPASNIPADERPINQHWSWDKILRSCFLKQADVLQGLYFLGHLYDTDVKRRNFLFYEPMTVHESSLSPCIHSIMASELGMKDKAVEMYKRTARLDLDNYNNDTEDGLHISSMSGSWLAIVQGFAGMRTAMGILSFKPFLPDGWSSYSFKINYRGRRLNVFVNKENAIVTLETGEPLEVIVSDIKYILKNEIKVLLPERQKEVINA